MDCLDKAERAVESRACESVFSTTVNVREVVPSLKTFNKVKKTVPEGKSSTFQCTATTAWCFDRSHCTETRTFCTQGSIRNLLVPFEGIVSDCELFDEGK